MNLPASTSFRAIGYLSSLFLAIYIFLAIIGSKSNGSFGEWIGHVAWMWLGSSAYVLPVLITLNLCDRIWRWSKTNNTLDIPLWARMTGTALLIFSISGLIALRSDADLLSGGIIGHWMNLYLQHVFGLIGTFFLFSLTFFVSIALTTAYDWMKLFESTGLQILAFFKKTIKKKADPLQEKKTTPTPYQLRKLSEKPTQHAQLNQLTQLNQPTSPTQNSTKKKSLFKGLLTWMQFPKKSTETSNDQPSATHSNTAVEPPLSIKPLNSLSTNTQPMIDPVIVTEPQLGQSLNTNISLNDTPSFIDSQDIFAQPIDSDQEHEEEQTPIDVNRAAMAVSAPKVLENILPNTDLLDAIPVKEQGFSDEELQKMGTLLQESLRNFNIQITVEAVQPGPVVTLFEVQPAPGVKVNQISLLAKDLARAMSVQSVRVVEVIPGKSCIGIEIPNAVRETVSFREVLESSTFQGSKHPMEMVLGKDIAGNPIVVNLAKMPHLLVAGTTGSGKSVGINSMILSLIFKADPKEVKMIMIDPKMLELSIYEGIPHLLTPVVTDMSNAASALKWSVAEMERRYRLMSLLGVRNIAGLNEKIVAAQKEGKPIKDPLHKPTAAYGHELAEDAPLLEKMSFIVIIIDEFADLMMVVGKQIEELIARLAQKARAAGIHLVLATQRPSVNVITGLIKANIPTRLSFQVSTKIDSRTILDQGGADQLLGMGDMLYLPPGSGMPIRAHGAFVSDNEVHRVVEFVKENQTPPEYINDLSEEIKTLGGVSGLSGDNTKYDDENDDLYQQAVLVVLESGKASISRVQRELRIGYNRAARIIEDMERNGLVSSMNAQGQREIL